MNLEVVSVETPRFAPSRAKSHGELQRKAGSASALAGYKRTDQDPEGGRSVTQFLSEKRS